MAEHNLVPLPYSRVSVQHTAVPLERTEVERFLLGKEAYYETDYVVLRQDRGSAVARVSKTGVSDFFARISGVEVLALPDACRFEDDPAVDTGNPSALAEKASALGMAPDSTLIVNGLYEHINFIHRPRPQVIQVFDLSPPDPPRLLDLARRALGYASFPAIVLEPHIQSIETLAEGAGDRPLLFPCGVSRLRALPQASYLDERPARKDWVLIGCERSKRIHRHFYGEDCPRIELCPVKLFENARPPAIMRCCMIEDGFQIAGGVAIVPFGAGAPLVERALRALIAGAEAT